MTPIHAATAAERDWTKESLTGLVRFILETHHVFTLKAIVSLPPLATQARCLWARKLPETRKVETLLHALTSDLAPHMQKEEQILFPYIEALDAAPALRTTPASCFGSVRNPIRMMFAEHDAAKDILGELRLATNGYGLPPDADAALQSLYTGLQQLEADLHRHIYLENEVLFPGAIRLEDAALRR